MGIGAKTGKRPQIVDSPEIRKRAQCPLRVGINLTSLLWPEEVNEARAANCGEKLPVSQAVSNEFKNPVRHLHLLPRPHSRRYRERPQDKQAHGADRSFVNPLPSANLDGQR